VVFPDWLGWGSGSTPFPWPQDGARIPEAVTWGHFQRGLRTLTWEWPFEWIMRNEGRSVLEDQQMCVSTWCVALTWTLGTWVNKPRTCPGGAYLWGKETIKRK
jgi:hypothetical protein